MLPLEFFRCNVASQNIVTLILKAKYQCENTITAMVTPAIFYSHWQLDILKAALRQKSKAVARVARCPQYLQHVAKSSIR